jgi:hypothetical protein
MPSPYLIVGLLSLLYIVARTAQHFSRRAKATRLCGPKSPSYLYGWMKVLENTNDTTTFYEMWSRSFGVVYRLPMAVSTEKVVVMDPKAIVHIFTKDTISYNQPTSLQLTMNHLVGQIRRHRTAVFAPHTSLIKVGPSLLTAEGLDHKRYVFHT